MTKLLYLFFTLIILASCAKKTVQPKTEITQEVVIETVIPQKSERVVFCKRLFELEQKLSFINDVYRAFSFGDSTLIKPYLNQSIELSIQNGSGGTNNFSTVSLSSSNLSNWTAFLNEHTTTFGTSVCTELKPTVANFKAETCVSNKGIKGNSYLNYIHFKKVKGAYVLTGVGLVIF